MEEKKDRIYEIINNERRLHDIESTIDLVDSIISYGYYKNASDVHIDPSQNGVVVRFRIDGILTYIDSLNEYLHEELIARIKVLAGLRTDIHFVPQDGRFRFSRNSYDCDIRVSVIPTHYGENTVLRILKNDSEIPTLGKLGFLENDVERIVKSVSYNQGMILVTGPTGSGKTSTLYTILSSLSNEKHSIITLEDPIEYAISGIRQIQIQSRHGITFSNGLRSIVRQDPDIIMVGEIRDTETAQIATNISLTGHLLLSTLHTNSSIGAIPRLIDMGVDPYLVASTLSLVIAQRLVRKICDKCIGAGCGECRELGFKGRVALAETLVVDHEMRKYIMSRTPLAEIERYAKSKGMTSMHEDGLEKVKRGFTTKEEISRVLHE
jgi:type IV pilus assembly protein PilB